MSERYNEKNTKEKEEFGRQKYLSWIAKKEECTHLCFSADRWCPFDAIFMSGGTQCITDIKARKYSANFFNKYGVEVDAKKARDVYRIAKKINALPIIVTHTSDGQFIISDLNLAKKDDIIYKWVQNNDNDHTPEWCELINLSGCTIS